MQFGVICEHCDVIQEQVHLGRQAASRSAVRRFWASGRQPALEHTGKHPRITTSPIVDGSAAKDMESHCERHPVQQ